MRRENLDGEDFRQRMMRSQLSRTSTVFAKPGRLIVVGRFGKKIEKCLMADGSFRGFVMLAEGAVHS